MYNVESVASAFLTLDSMTHKKLQKLCYYAQAHYIATFNKKMIDTTFEAWVHGPVSPDLYHLYKKFGFSNIPQVSKKMFNTESQDYKFIKKIFEIYGSSSADELEILTHSQNPWINARENCQNSFTHSNKEITYEAMRDYYEPIL